MKQSDFLSPSVWPPPGPPSGLTLWVSFANSLYVETRRQHRLTARVEARRQHVAKKGEARAQVAGGRVGEQGRCGWAVTFHSWDGAQWTARQGRAAEAAVASRSCEASVLCSAGTRRMPGPGRADEGGETMRHTEVKVDKSQNTMSSKPGHGGRQSVILSSQG